MVHLNSTRITLTNGNDTKVFYLFSDGMARDMTNGFGELVNFSEVSKKLKAEGYAEKMHIKATRRK